MRFELAIKRCGVCRFVPSRSIYDLYVNMFIQTMFVTKRGCLAADVSGLYCVYYIYTILYSLYTYVSRQRDSNEASGFRFDV